MYAQVIECLRVHVHQKSLAAQRSADVVRSLAILRDRQVTVDAVAQYLQRAHARTAQLTDAMAALDREAMDAQHELTLVTADLQATQARVAALEGTLATAVRCST